jgi:Uma2 family endonuclease
MEETVVRPPKTIMDVFKMLPETTLAEVINNQLYRSPAPVGRHQRVISKLFTQIYDHAVDQNLGEAFVSPFDVFLDEKSNAVQPDIFFIAADRLDMVDDDGGVHGVPDLIVEILSSGNPQHDRITKKALYQNFKVKEYWVVDPVSRKANGYKLVKGLYQALPVTTSKLTSPLLKATFKF